ncbi:fimbria assembly protein [Enterobacter pseudoroggenkampii]|jgi:minor fimbrial subunit|uniref:Fimbria assembly protein n=1 Tax=Enterobacter pseudoroggenkampii TaxID=2996112 RepID=A0ABT3X6W9_9ENTR|nr:fimbria assembly protein [Enterobacter pseudoroggenkampii]MCK4227032.1 fimbria assembly protein [Enterobacter asburiae]MCK6906128.1 fimbria assembly protein [Enterobacter roggenkampii]MCX8289614.1 fimbria assembly protein [Enterobacter pseudoroggenkampii]MCX8301563.1 fimbria assembly protein [Enterobacter pseudoroggenkampii]WJW87046.1 fimbria assembly protein [Enterobacter pseudoroggenkampii]
MRNGIRFITVALLALCTQAQADTALGEINIRLYGNIVDFTCVAEGSDSDKTVTLGTWPTKQLSTTGSRTQPMPFTLKLTGCPPGAASITFSGKADGSNNGLLALNDASTASHVAVEIRDADKTRLALQQASQPVSVDAQGNATLSFYANYIATADNPQPGRADADATFMINYN